MPEPLTVRSSSTIMAALLHHGLEARNRDGALACVEALNELELVDAALVLDSCIRDTDADPGEYINGPQS